MLLALICECYSYAQTFDFDSITYIITSEEDKTVDVVSGNNITGEVTIPAIVSYSDKDYYVTCIDNDAFKNCTGLTSLTIAEGVLYINDGAFYGCSSLSYLSLPSTIAEIGNYVFTGCERLLTAGPKGGGYNYEFNWEIIPANAFRGMTYLESAFIPKTVKAVYECDDTFTEWHKLSGAVFDGCENLRSVAVSFKDTKLIKFYRHYYYNGADYIMTDITYYNESPMDFNLYKTNFINSLTILDDTITSLYSALANVDEIVISKDVKYIDPNAFHFTPYEEEIAYYDDNLHSWGLRLYNFSGVNNIKVEDENSYYSSIVGILFNKQGNELLVYPSGRSWCNIPATTKKIADSAFKGSVITSAIIPSNVEIIGERAFEACSALEKVVIEGSPEIGQYAFWDCPNIKIIATNSVPGKMNTSDTPQTIMVGASYYEDGESLTKIPRYNQELGRMVSEITSLHPKWSCAFLSDAVTPGKYKVVVGILPNNDDLPNRFSFRIDDVTDPDSIYYIFSGRKGTRLINWTSNETKYDLITVADSIVIPEDCKEIRITITNQWDTKFSKRMMFDRVFLEPIGNDYPVESYSGPFSKDVFNNAMLYVPEGAVSTYQAADGWKLFKNIKTDYQTTFNIDGIIYKINQNDNNSVTIIDYRNDTNDIVIPSVVSYNDILYVVTEIGNSAFADCTQLKSITIPASVSCVGDGAFYECDSLERVSFEGSPRICTDAFYGCNNISYVSSLSPNPGIMELAHFPQTFLVGDTTDFYFTGNNNQDLKIKHFLHPELGEWVSEITSSMYGWQCNLKSDAVTPGTYRILIVILPNSDGQPSLFHPIIYGVKDDQLETIYDPTTKIAMREYPTTFSNDITADYEFIEIADSLTIPTGYDYIVIGIQSQVNITNADKYSNRINLYRFYLVECYDETEAFPGPFTEKVFNNAMLYVPEGAVSTYQAAAGWKLFKNICIDDAVDPIRLDDKVNGKDRIIYDFMGRKVEAESIEQLTPGLYIIGGSTFLIQ